jgi:hypothetical protein
MLQLSVEASSIFEGIIEAFPVPSKLTVYDLQFAIGAVVSSI